MFDKNKNKNVFVEISLSVFTGLTYNFYQKLLWAMDKLN